MMNDKEPMIERYADLLDEHAEAELLNLVKDLEVLYTSSTVPTHLSQKFTESVDTITFSSLENEAKTTSQSLTTHSVPFRRQKRWTRPFTVLVAAVLTTFVVGSLLFVFNLAYQSKTVQGGLTIQQGTPKQGTPIKYLPNIKMIDEQRGWAWMGDLGTPQYAVLYTDDGGVHWKNVSPSLPGQFYESKAFFLDASTAMLTLERESNTPWELLRTLDSGRTWQTLATPCSQINGFNFTIDFINVQTGWITCELMAAGNLSEVDLFRTVDGGQSWAQVSVSKAATNGTPGVLPFNGNLPTITFFDDATGWATGFTSEKGSTWLYVTHDGGHTWVHQRLQLPSNVSVDDYPITWPPQFFSAKDGLLPVSFWSPKGLAVYITHNGGTTWQAAPLFSVGSYQDPHIVIDAYSPTDAPYFVDMNHGWVSVNGDYNTFFQTDDGTQHWREIKYPRSSSDIYGGFFFDFVSSKVGWLNIYTSVGNIMIAPGHFPGKSFLFKTTDGGQTWTQIQPVLV